MRVDTCVTPPTHLRITYQFPHFCVLLAFPSGEDASTTAIEIPQPRTIAGKAVRQ